MKKPDQYVLYACIEFVIWLIIITLCVFGIRYHFHKSQLQYKSYQIFMNEEIQKGKLVVTTKLDRKEAQKLIN